MIHTFKAAVLSVLLILSCAAGVRATADTLLPPAAGRLGLPPRAQQNRFANPVAGPTVECAGITRQMFLLNPNIVVGEPVEFRLLLHADDPEPDTEFIAKLLPETDFRYLIQPPFGQPYYYKGQELGETVPTAVLQMKKSPTFRYDFRLAMDKDSVSGAAFDLPGTYQIRVLHNCNVRNGEPQLLELGVFELNVSEASGDDLTAFRILSSDFTSFEPIHTRLVRTATGKTILKPKHSRMLREVIEKAPNSRLAPHAMFVVALEEMHGGSPQEALRLFEQIIERFPDTPYREEALFGIIRVHVREKDLEKSAQAFRRIWSDPTATQLIYPGSTYYDSFIGKGTAERPGSQWMLWTEPGADPLSEREAMAAALQDQFGAQMPFPVQVVPAGE